MDKNNDFLNAVSEAIEKTILKFIGKDFFYYAAPYVSKSKITKSCNFFKDNRVTLPTRSLEEEELRTISYLAPYYRKRVSYNPRNIDYYLRSIGALNYDKESVRAVLAYHKDHCGDVDSAIPIEALRKLKNPILSISVEVSFIANRNPYIDGLDLLHDKAGIK